MRPKPIFMLVVALLICWLSVWSLDIAIGSQPAQGEAGVDLLLLVDASDSMRMLDEDKLADQIAHSVLRYLAEYFPYDTTSRVGIICFSDKMTPLLKLTPLSEVDLEQVSVECERSGGTLFVKILKEVPSVFTAELRPENRKVILLITDGHPSVAGESVLIEDKDNRNYLANNVIPEISGLQRADEKLRVYVIGVGKTKFVDVWSQYEFFIRVEDSDDLIKIRNLLEFAIAPPPSPTPTLTPIPSPSPSPISTSVPTATPSPSPSPTITSIPTSTASPSPSSTPMPTPTLSPSPTKTPSPSPTLKTTPTSTVTPTNTPTSSPTPTPTTGPEGIVMPWSGVGIVVLLIAVLMGGLAVMVLCLKDAVGRWKEETEKRERIEEDLREKGEALTKAIRASQLEREARKSKTLLRKAEKALEKEEPGQARRFAEQVIENAVRYGEAVLDRMAADVGGAFDIIRRATEDKGEWADILFKYFRDGSLIVQRGLASALKIWWANYPNEAIESIYALISKGGQNILKLIGDREVSGPEGVPEVIENNAKMVGNICKSLHSLLARESDEDLASLLSEVADAFDAASDTFAYAGDAQVLYRCMAQLAEHPLWPVEFPVLSGESLPYFQNVVQLLKQGFTLPSPAWEGLSQLKRLEREVNSHVE